MLAAPVINKREDISKYAPKIMTTVIRTEKIKDIISDLLEKMILNKIIDAT